MLVCVGLLALLNTILATSLLEGAPASVPLAHHLNDIDSVICDSSKVAFLSRDGAIVHSRRDSSWSFDFGTRFTGQSIPLSQYYELRDSELYRWLYEEGLLRAFRSTYVSALRGITRDSTLTILTTGAGEGAVLDTNCILDTSQSKNFCYPLDKTKTLDFDKHSFWLGRFDGLASISRADGQRFDFVVLPTINENSSVLTGSHHLWIATDGNGIQRIALQTRKVTFWRAEDILADLLQRRYEHNPHLRPKGKVVFSNFAATQDGIYIGCYFVSGNNDLVTSSSFLLEFQPTTEEWKARWLYANGIPWNGVSIIKVYGRRLIMGGTHQDRWEGGGHEEFGGVFYYLPSQGSMYEQPDVDLRHLVTSMRETETGDLLIETFEPSDIGRKRTYRLDREFRITVVSDSVGASYEEFRREKSIGNPRGPEALPDSFHALPVAPEVWPLRQSHVEVTTY
jgi:hypothetical protein